MSSRTQWRRRPTALAVLLSGIVLTVSGACRSRAGSDAGDRAAGQPAATSPVPHRSAPPADGPEKLRRVIADAARLCDVWVERCVVTGCLDQLDTVEREITQDPALFKVMTKQVRGDSREAVTALSLSNGLLARWQRDGLVSQKLDRRQRRDFVDAALTNRCSGVLLSPLILPGGPLALPVREEMDGGS